MAILLVVCSGLMTAGLIGKYCHVLFYQNFPGRKVTNFPEFKRVSK